MRQIQRRAFQVAVGLVAVVGLLAVAGTVSAQVPKAAKGDWPWWRGPNFNGVAESGQKPPIRWSATKNVAWKAAVPGRGHSTPIVVGQRVFLQTADDKAKSQSVLCYDRATGKPLWQKELHRGNFQERINPKNTYATSTIACDGGRLFVLFSNNAAVKATAMDLDGKVIWKTTAAPFIEKKYPNGYAASPVLYGNTVIVASDCEGGGTLLALDRDTGKRVWATSRVGKTNYASPVVGHVAGRDQLLIGGLDMVASYDPKTASCSGTHRRSRCRLPAPRSGRATWCLRPAAIRRVAPRASRPMGRARSPGRTTSGSTSSRCWFMTGMFTGSTTPGSPCAGRPAPAGKSGSIA